MIDQPDVPPSRRSFLGAAAVAAGATGAGVIGAIVGWSTGRPARRTTPPGVTPATAPVLAAAVRREQALIRRLDSAAASTPTLATRVAVLVADHQAHLESLQALVRGAGASPASASGSASGSAQGSVGATVKKADLAAWEEAASAAAARDSARLFGDGAVLLGAISACDTSHVAWLG